MNGRQKKSAKDGGALLKYTAGDGTEWCWGFNRNLIIKAALVQCSLHPHYKALRPPRADCSSCRTMYENRIKQ